MTDVIGYAGQIIEVIQAVRAVYVRVKGIEKEIDDAMADCGNMETDVKTLKKLFNKQTSNKYPEQVNIITQQFKSLHRSIKKLKKLFQEYEKISMKLFGKFLWAYDKPREAIFEIRERFGEYRGIFTKALHIINEGHNKDQERALKELKDQAKRVSEERKKAEKEMKEKLRKMDERNKRDNERLEKLLMELMARNLATPENRSKVYEGWLVEEKGVGREEARTCAATALAKGNVPTVKKAPEDASTKNNKGKLKGADPLIVKEDHAPNNANGKPSIKDEKSKKLTEPTPTKVIPVNGKKTEGPAKKDSKNIDHEHREKGAANPKANNPSPQPSKPKRKDDLAKASKPQERADPNKQNKQKDTNEPSKPPKPKPAADKQDKTKKPKVPVILIQDTNKLKQPTPSSHLRGSSPSPSIKSTKSEKVAVPSPRPRASSIPSNESKKSQKERIEKGVRYVNGGDKRGRSQEPAKKVEEKPGMTGNKKEKEKRSVSK